MQAEFLLRPEIEIGNRRKSAIITGAIIALLLLLAIFIILARPEPKFPEEGILISFGTTETGQGYEPPTKQVETASDAAPKQVEEVTENVEVTQDVNATAIDDQPQENPVETPIETPDNQTGTNTQEVKEPVKEKLTHVFSDTKSDDQSQSSSQGSNMGTGDAGDPDGSKYSDKMGTQPGQGKAGATGYLSGRGVSSTPTVEKKVRKEQGKIRLEIFVDPQGNVIRTGVIMRGSDITDPAMLEEARKIAKRFKFEAKSDATALQKGYVEIIFKY